jgi:TonB family protein
MGPSKLPGIAALALGVACFATTVHWAKAQTGQMATQQPVSEEWGITVSSTGQVLHRNRVPYPEATYKSGIQGTVMLEVTLDQSGNVADVHVLSGPTELRKTALQSVLQWQFASAYAGETQQVSITFRRDPRAQRQAPSQDELAQARLTTSFLEDEIRAAKEQGDSRAMQGLQEKLQQALAQMAEVVQRNRALESLSETDPTTVALMRQIDVLNEEITTFKQANQGRLAGDADASESLRLLESQYALLMEQKEHGRQSPSERNPQALALTDQIEALRKKMDAASLVGSTLARIEISGLSERAKDELAIGGTIQIGEVLSQESMNSAIAAIHQFDQRLECRFQRDGNGDVVLRITGPGRRE